MLLSSIDFRNLIHRLAVFPRRAVALLLCSVGILLLPIMSAATAWSQETKAIQLVGFDYAPFYQEKDGTINGIAVELAREIFARLGMQPDVSIFPLKRALALLRHGQADGTMILIKTSEREEFLRFTQPIMTVRGLMWSLADREDGSIQFDELEDLKQYRIGVTRGYSYGPDFDRLLEKMNADIANSDYSNYLKLLQHRIDVFPGNEIVAQGLFKEYPELQGKFVHSQKAFMEWDLRIAISRKSQHASMLPAIDAVLSDLKNEGVVDKIVKKFTQ